MKFVNKLKRPEKINAIEQYLEQELTPSEKEAWQTRFETIPEPFTSEEKKKWLNKLRNISLSSDAFFPFRDNIDRASRSGVAYIVQPGSSIKDADVIEAANEYDMVMVFSGVRLFHH